MSDGEPQSKKPEDSDFQQQRLKAWQPLLTPKWVIGTFLVITAVFIPIGAVIVAYSNRVVEQELRYDTLVGYPATCNPYLYDKATNTSSMSGTPCVGDANTCRITGLDYAATYTDADVASTTACSHLVNMTIEEDMNAPVYFYYKLSNYFQNHRRYVKSRSDTQLSEDSATGDTSTCDPLERDSQGRTYYPCGLIAGSFFVDRFSASLTSTASNGQQVTTSLGNWSQSTNYWKKDGIAWASDKKDKFKVNYNSYNDDTRFNHRGLLDVKLPLVNDEDFIVWMRTAGLPTFKKLYRVINRDLKKGDVLTIAVLNYYPVQAFSGQKAMVLSTTSWLGGKNSFLGWAYIVVGIICFTLAIAFLIKHLVSPRPLGDMAYFAWPGAAAAPTNRASQQ